MQHAEVQPIVRASFYEAPLSYPQDPFFLIQGDMKNFSFTAP